MLTLKATIRKNLGKGVKILRKKGILPGILYGSKIKNLVLEIDSKEFDKVYQSAGESSLISLEIEGKKTPVLIHDIQRDPLNQKPIHVDLYQPSLSEEVTVKVPLIFDGEPPAVKELGGTLVKSISEVEVRALPQNLPHEIRIDVSQLKTFEDKISMKDLKLPEGVKLLKESEIILAFVAPIEKVEEELMKPIEEKVEEVKAIEKEKAEEGEEGEVEGEGESEKEKK